MQVLNLCVSFKFCISALVERLPGLNICCLFTFYSPTSIFVPTNHPADSV